MVSKNQFFLKSKIVACATFILALVYLVSPLQNEVLKGVHELEHKLDHATSSDHNHRFLNADQLLAEAGHDHRTIEYIKQVLEPFGDDFQQEKEDSEPLKIDKHIQSTDHGVAHIGVVLIHHPCYDFSSSIPKKIVLNTPSPPPKLQ